MLAYRQAGLFVNYLRESDGSAFGGMIKAILDGRSFVQAVDASYHQDVRRPLAKIRTDRCRAKMTARDSRRLRRLQSEPRFDRLTHHEFLDLAGDRHRKFVDELDIARDLVVGDLSMTEGTHLVGGQRFARARPDPCAELFAVTIVSDAKNLHVLDFWMPVQKFLDLARIEVLAARSARGLPKSFAP